MRYYWYLKILCNIDLSNVAPHIIIKHLRLLKLPKLIWIKTIHSWLAILDVRPSNFWEAKNILMISSKNSQCRSLVISSPKAYFCGDFHPLTASVTKSAGNFITKTDDDCNKLSICGEGFNPRHPGRIRHDRHWEALSRRWPEGPELGAMKEVP